jgi:hypothetical protein
VAVARQRTVHAGAVGPSTGRSHTRSNWLQLVGIPRQTV